MTYTPNGVRVTLADLKRRLVPGTELEVVAHSKRPELIGSRRTITASRSTQYTFTTPIADGNHTSNWPKASEVEWIDRDTFSMPVGLFSTVATFRILDHCPECGCLNGPAAEGIVAHSRGCSEPLPASL